MDDSWGSIYPNEQWDNYEITHQILEGGTPWGSEFSLKMINMTIFRAKITPP
jgi:hypothetical protein